MNVNRVRVIQDRDPTQTGDDFVRVSCEGDEATGVFTIIERVVADARQGVGWRFRKLFHGLLGSEAAALDLATAYAEHKGVPVVYAEMKRR
jgi:hypothetical protein